MPFFSALCGVIDSRSMGALDRAALAYGAEGGYTWRRQDTSVGNKRRGRPAIG